MFFASKQTIIDAIKESLGTTEDTVALNKTIKTLKDEIAQLKSDKKIEEMELKHLVKMKEEKQAIELQKAMNDQTKSFNEKEMALQTKYHEKVMSVVEKNGEKSQELYNEILKRLPTVTVDINRK